ncbi:MAG TPA: Vps62-related protein [Solirubrobacterales bacterium]|nr:Vps62-related protein [Solirubrobacterales bacterium]
MTLDPELLFRHRPVLKYDSQECYFADSAAIWVECPGNSLNRSNGSVGNASGGGELSLDFLGASYADDVRARATDVVSDPSRNYREQAGKLHLEARYRNRIYGRVTPDERWLQYWFFYFYNDYNLIGHLIGAGRHEGDWEMVQIQLDGGAPTRAVYAQHTDGESRHWQQVDLMPGTERPIVYVARGSHASYFEPGTHWTGHWFDHADGRRRSPDQELIVVAEGEPEWHWLGWPGRWGDTVEGDLPIDSSSPVGPAQHAQWDEPGSLAPESDAREAAVMQPPPPVPPAPHATAELSGDRILLDYRLPDGAAAPKGLAIAVNSPDEAAPPSTYQVEVDAASGSVVVPHDASPSQRYDLYVSQADSDGLASPATRIDLAPAQSA